MKWFILGRLFLDSGTEYEASSRIVHPDYVYEGRVLSWGYVDRSISAPSGLPQVGDCQIRLADTDGKFRDLLAHQTPRRRFMDLRLAVEGASQEDRQPFATFEIFDFEFQEASVQISGRDTTFSWIDKPIPGLINRTNFPDLMEGIDEAFMPIISGVLDAPSDASPPNPQGVLTLPRMTLTRWGLAQHPILYVELCGAISNEVEFTLIDPSEYEITEEVHVIDGISYTLSFIDFNEEQDIGLEVRCRIIEGFYTRGAFGSLPAVENSPLSALRNPIDFLINMLYATVVTETRIPRFNTDSFEAVHVLLATGLVTSTSPPSPYACDGAITQPITVREFLGQFLTSFELDLYVNRLGEIEVGLTLDEDPDRPVFSDGPVYGELTDNSLILANTVRQRAANPTFNRLRYNYSLNYSTEEFAGKAVFNNDDDQLALAGPASPPIPFIEEPPEALELRFVRESAVAEDVARRRMQYLALGSYRIELQLPLPEVFDDLELAKLIGVTHRWGLEVGGFRNREVKVTGLTYDLDQKLCTVRGILRVPQTIDQAIHEEPTAENTFTGETYIEALDFGIVASDEAGTFFRSAFYIPPDLTNLGFDDERIQCFIEGVAENLEASPVLWKVGAHGDGVTVPANYAGRVRSSTAFDRRDESTFYITSPVVETGSTLYRLRMAIQHTRARKVYSEIQMSNSFSATGLDQTIGGGDIFRTTSWGLPGSLSGFVSIGGPRFKYVAADWDTITNVRIVAAVANASFHLGPDDPNPQSSEVALWDLDQEALMEDDPGMVAIMQCSGEAIFLSPRLFVQDVNVLSLVDGHTYELRIRSVKDNVDQGDFNTYFHKGRLGISVSPVQSIEFHARVGNETGPGETQLRYPGATVPESSIHFEAHNTPDTTPFLTDLGASDTAIVGTDVNESQVPIEDALPRSARSGNIAGVLTVGNRYAVGGVLQGSMVTKIPAVPAVVIPSVDMAPRAAFLQELDDAGFTANRALLFNEMTGVPVEFYTSTPVSESGSPTWVSNAYGWAKKCSATSKFLVGTSNAFLNTTGQTILVIRRKIDATARVMQLFSPSYSANDRRCSAHVPYSDGKVYWDFGGATAPNRVTWNDYVLSVAVEAWGFVAGASGSAIWKDGVKVASQGTAITNINESSDFNINDGPGGPGDLEEFYFFAAIPAEVSDVVMATFTPDHVLLGL